MPTRGTAITVHYKAWDTAAQAYKTGDAANHSMFWTADDACAATQNAPVEVNPATVPGQYRVTLTSAESLCDVGMLDGKSSTPDVIILPTEVTFDEPPVVLNTGTAVTGLGPVNRSITIVPGDDYTIANGRALDESIVGGPSLSGATAKLKIQLPGGGTLTSSGNGQITGSGTTLDPWRVRVELLAAQTALLTTAGPWVGFLTITRSGADVVTPVKYLVTVEPDL